MADSNMTKRALSAALKELMGEMPFAKITVADICEKCDMNRKSFYYHFRDKYDLVNWIYDTEFIAIARKRDYPTTWAFLEDLCGYFYENRSFYRKALSVRGQDAFSDHFREMMLPAVALRMKEILPEGEGREFQISFFTDAIVDTIQRWMLEKDCMEPSEFLRLLRSCIEHVAVKVYRDMEEETIPGHAE